VVRFSSRPSGLSIFPITAFGNVWSCEACGYEFEDTVYWSARELVDAE
jgi:rubrerythrin